MPYEYICEYCGKAFSTRNKIIGKRAFCSTKCYHEATKTGSILICLHCGKQIYRPKCRIDRGEQYCSDSCRLAATPMIDKVCPVCGKTFHVKVSTADRYTVCSYECRLRKTKWWICQRCGKRFSAKSRNRQFCSAECRDQPVQITCKTCGKQFMSEKADTDRQFCSNSCYHRFRGPNLLETKVEQCLKSLDLSFIPQGQVGKYSIDFLFPDCRIALEVDGEYWHKDPTRDARKERYLQQYGWTVIRVKEREINNSDNPTQLLIDKLNEVPGIQLISIQFPLF